MLVLYHCVSARSFRPLWLMEELGIPFELRMLAFPPRVHARSYLMENPLGTVPLLVDGDIRMTESAAMCQYLAARHGSGCLDVQVSDAKYGTYLNWLHMSDATLTFPQTLVLRYRHFEPPHRLSPQVAQDYERWFLARLKLVTVAVTTSDFLCGERFTAADVAVGYALMLAEHLELSDQFPAPVMEYWKRLKLRPAFDRALTTQFEMATAQGVPTIPSPDIRP